jgi:ubiquinone/menaquinone biosynthesis C-methylase UbiE
MEKEHQMKADYHKIAEFYDRGRPISEKNLELWTGLISRYCGPKPNLRLLDLGCGTGRFTLPITQHLGYRVTGADSSHEMLAKAREKDKEKIVTWNLQDAQHLTYSGDSFDAVFMSHLLHHIESPFQVLKECRRVLSSSGVILVRYGAFKDIRQDVEHTFFPETLSIEKARASILSGKIIEKWLQEAGFPRTVTEVIKQQTYETGTAHLDAVKNKSTSVLTLISQVAFEAGVNRLSHYIEEHPDDPWLLFDNISLTAGYVDR